MHRNNDFTVMHIFKSIDFSSSAFLKTARKDHSKSKAKIFGNILANSK